MGLKVTVRLQETAAATVGPQPFVVRVNSPGLVPVKVVPVTLKSELPVLVRVVVKGLVCPTFAKPKFKLAGTIFTVPLVTVTVAPADLVVSVTEVAVTVIAAGVGTSAGAVYVVGVSLAVLPRLNAPHVEHRVPSCTAVHLTPAFAGSFRTVGVNAWVIFTGMIAEIGEMEIVIARTVTVVEFDFVESVREAAEMVTGKSAVGGAEGAVYVTEVLV
jgi:hypothetical protein